MQHVVASLGALWEVWMCERGRESEQWDDVERGASAVRWEIKQRGRVVHKPHMLCSVHCWKHLIEEPEIQPSFPRRWYKWDMLVTGLLHQTAAYKALHSTPHVLYIAKRDCAVLEIFTGKKDAVHPFLALLLSSLLMWCTATAFWFTAHTAEWFNEGRARVKGTIINYIFVIFFKAAAWHLYVYNAPETCAACGLAKSRNVS